MKHLNAIIEQNENRQLKSETARTRRCSVEFVQRGPQKGIILHSAKRRSTTYVDRHEPFKEAYFRATCDLYKVDPDQLETGAGSVDPDASDSLVESYWGDGARPDPTEVAEACGLGEDPQSRTCLDYLGLLPRGYRERALAQCSSPDLVCPDLQFALESFTIWHRTGEGYDFWRDVWKAVSGDTLDSSLLPPLPRFSPETYSHTAALLTHEVYEAGLWEGLYQEAQGKQEGFVELLNFIGRAAVALEDAGGGLGWELTTEGEWVDCCLNAAALLPEYYCGKLTQDQWLDKVLYTRG